MWRHVRCHLRQESPRSISIKQQLHQMIEDNINEVAEMDTRKNKKISHQKCYHPIKGTHKANKYGPRDANAVMFGHVERGVSCPYLNRLSLTGSRRLNAHIWRLAN